MADNALSDAGAERAFNVGYRALMPVVAIFAVLAILPIMSLHELLTTGTIDLDAVGQGSRKTPTWISYLVGWGCFLLVLVANPFRKYFTRPEMFRLGPQGITLSGVNLAPDEVLGFGVSPLRGFVLHSSRGDFPIHPWLIKGATRALAEAFPNVAWHTRKEEWPSWLLGE
ncbi:hypothetical protein [Porphyrobacter sp. ULC335]|uniref:hypothetical protein n=1 Tax=Porphyrobacter sp. ULC335 TaxID=2854260 RepID=UPI00221F1088|nr:hypothetical protein [Porphyrobacter sp. ULC335]UYV14721.1 hypothetical protein KVF90_11255 [Porphyrobacter sp. ULC335]